MTIPVFITYRDRRQMLATTVASLLARGLTDITVIDNGSDPPLEDCPPVKVVRADNSARQLAPWALGLVPQHSFYIVMDCDIELDCPPDVADHLVGILADHPEIEKIGLGIRTDDLLNPAPAHYAYSYRCERDVAHIYQELAPGVVNAPVDTHFALYRPGHGWGGIGGTRTTAPYLCRHLPWYNADYSEEEVRYYQRAGRTWASTHCAETLAPVKVVVPFTALRAETVAALGGADVLYRPVLSDTGYCELLAECWDAIESFVVVEHKIVVGPGTLAELRDCDGDWCAAPYPYLDKPAAVGMGCVKFRDRLIVRHPGMMRYVAAQAPQGHSPGHWCTLDALIWRYLTERREHRCERHAAVGKIDAGHSSHGCQ